MAYKEIAIPRVYTDWVNWMEVTGQESVSGAVSLTSGAMTLGVIEDAFDLNPANVCTINASSVNNVTIRLDTNQATDEYMDWNYLAILGHDLHTANCKFRIVTDDSSTWASANYPAMTEKVNGSISGGYCTPSYNGWTLIEWNQATDNRYIGLQFFHDDGSSNMSADIEIGAIMFGKYYDFPHRPNLSHKINQVYKTSLKESLGGARYSVAYNNGHNPWHRTLNKWVKTSSTTGMWNARTGRTIFDLSWSFVKKEDMWRHESTNDEYVGGDVSIENLLLHKVHGSHCPFIFQLDNTKFDENHEELVNFYLVRMTKYSMQQTAPNLWTFSCTLEEEL